MTRHAAGQHAARTIRPADQEWTRTPDGRSGGEAAQRDSRGVRAGRNKALDRIRTLKDRSPHP